MQSGVSAVLCARGPRHARPVLVTAPLDSAQRKSQPSHEETALKTLPSEGSRAQMPVRVYSCMPRASGVHPCAIHQS